MKVDVGMAPKWALMSDCEKEKCFSRAIVKRKKCLENRAIDVILKTKSPET